MPHRIVPVRARSGLGSAWHLSHVEVVAQATGDRYYFLAGKGPCPHPPLLSLTSTSLDVPQQAGCLQVQTGLGCFLHADQWLDKKLGTLTLTLEPSDAKGAKQIYKVRTLGT